MRRIFVLGAGASRAGGIPALKELSSYFIENSTVALFIREVFGSELTVEETDFLPRLDDLYSIIDYALLHDHKLGRHSQYDLRLLRRELNLGLCKLFAKDTKEADYAGTVELYRRFATDLSIQQDAVITLNWDTALDYVLEKEKGLALDYGLNNGNGQSFPLIKPHGSVNWAWCQACSQLTITGYDFKDLEKLKCQTCGEENLSPLLVGPTILPRHRDTPLENCWLQAIRKVIQADQIYFIGLSLDAIDLEILEAVKRGILLNKKNPQFFVIGRGLGEEPEVNALLKNGTVQRYIQLFGPNIAFNMEGFQGKIPQQEKFIEVKPPLPGNLIN